MRFDAKQHLSSQLSDPVEDFTLDVYFRQHWSDPRLRFREEEDELCISNEMLSKIWWPDTFFANAKKANFHFATTKNAFLRIKPSGEITQSLRLTVQAMCNMDLTYFPMDSQICSLEIESYGYSTKDIAYRWRDGAVKSVGLHKDVQLPQFNVQGYRTNERLIELSTGNYSRLACELFFVRSLGYYVIQIYIPSCLIVVLSWVSFWLSRDAVPARVALGITTVLTMTTLISSTNASLPKISYLKSIDVYLVTCFFMVFASLLEYASVSFISHVTAQRARDDIPLTNRPNGAYGDAALEEALNALQHGESYRSRRRIRRLETHASTTPKAKKMASAKKKRKMSDPDLHMKLSAQSSIANNTGALTSKPVTPSSEQRQGSFQTEVRLTSMEKPYTECDLRPDTFNGNNIDPPVVVDSDVSVIVSSPKTGIWRMSWEKCGIHPATIDAYARIIFPFSFLVFNLIYWITYLNIRYRPDEAEFVSSE
ncbi:Gamma-aminobutyric acid receptor subunit beta [Lamellibrachia satsuma]|nr:Gamma-aminobutyric acid receptor subunit beta [Lamellibrachia satsuma]